MATKMHPAPDEQRATDPVVFASGTVRGGEYAGWRLLVQDDREQTGGWLLLLEHPTEPAGYDNWVEAGALHAYFAEAPWDIEWTQAPGPEA